MMNRVLVVTTRKFSSSARKGAVDVLADELGVSKRMMPVMNQLFPFGDPFKGNFFQDNQLLPIAPHSIPCDLKETKDTVNFSFEVPGVNKKDLELTIQDLKLYLKAGREAEKTESGENYIKMERFSGSSYRSIALPSTIDVHKDISAKLENGILSVKMHKFPDHGKIESKLQVEIK